MKRFCISFIGLMLLSALFMAMSAAGWGAMQWIDDSAMASKMDIPRAVFRGKLIGGANEELITSTVGMSIFDGSYSYFGASLTAGYTSDCVWAFDDIGIFVHAFKSDAAKLYKSKTGLADDDFVSVLDTSPVNAGLLARCVVDCGRHTINSPDDALGDVERRLLLCFEYNGAGPCGDLWYSAQPVDSAAGDNGTWYKVFNATPLSIKHWHGGVYVKGKGLYVFTGDSNIQSSILFCSTADLPTLIESPDTWYDTNWLLGTGDRDAWSGTVSTNHVLIGNVQNARTVDLLTSDSKYGYYKSDSAAVADLPDIVKVNFFDTGTYSCGSYSILAVPAGNTGWYGCATSSGLIYISTVSTWGDDVLITGQTLDAEIYCIDPETDQIQIVKRIRRGDYDAARSILPEDDVMFGSYHCPLIEYQGTVFGVLNISLADNETGDLTYNKKAFYGKCLKQKQRATNYYTNGSFQSGFTGWDIETNAFNNVLAITSGNRRFLNNETITGATSGATALARADATLSSGSWDGSAVGYVLVDAVSGIFKSGEKISSSGGAGDSTISAINTGEVIDDPTGEIGGKVCRVVFKGHATAFPGQPAYKHSVSLTTAQKLALEGHSVNHSCKFYIPITSGEVPKTVRPGISISATPGSRYWSRLARNDIIKNKWHTFDMQAVVGTGASLHRYIFYPQYTYTNTDEFIIYFTDSQLIDGAIRNDEIELIGTGKTGILGTQTYDFLGNLK